MRTWGRSWMVFTLAAGVYLSLSLSGTHFGLPDQFHILSYSCDETGWIEGLSRMTPRREFNPHPELNQPLFFQECYAGAVGVAAELGWIPIHESNVFFRAHPDIFGRIYLVGRWLESLLGIILLFAVWWFGHLLYEGATGDIAVMLLAVTPSLIGASHVVQSNVAVATVAFLALAFLLRDEQQSEHHARWLMAGGYASGLAVATKYSALPLLPLCLFQALRAKNPCRRFFLVSLFMVLGFLQGEPFALFAPHTFVASFHTIAGDVFQIPQTLGSMVLFPYLYPIRFALGTPLWGAAVVCVIILLITSFRRFQLPLLWLALTCFCITAAGRVATSGRVFIIIPVLVLAVSGILAHGVKKTGWMRIVSWGAFIALYGLTLLYALSIVALHRGVPIQKQASEWIDHHIPRQARLGVPRAPYYWSPDIVLTSYFWPTRMDHPYQVSNLNFNIAQARQMDYILVSAQEWKSAAAEGAEAPGFFNWLQNGKEFHLVHVFPRHVGIGSWIWDRPELELAFDDDLWSYSYYIYQRGPA